MTVHGPGVAPGGDALVPSSPDNTSFLLTHWTGCSISLLWKEEKVKQDKKDAGAFEEN